MSTLSRQEIKANNDFNGMCVNTVDTQEKKYAKLDYICLFMQGLFVLFACIGSSDPVMVLCLYTMNTLGTL